MLILRFPGCAVSRLAARQQEMQTTCADHLLLNSVRMIAVLTPPGYCCNNDRISARAHAQEGAACSAEVHESIWEDGVLSPITNKQRTAGIVAMQSDEQNLVIGQSRGRSRRCLDVWW